MSPIWPEVTPEKANLFNRYGRGIVHMGLHIGTAGFVQDRNPSKKKRKVLERVNVTEVNMLLDEIEEAAQIDTDFIVRGQRGRPTAGSMYAYNGTGDDWQAHPSFKLTGDFGPVVLCDIKARMNASVLNQWGKIGILIDGVLDMETVFRQQYTTGANAGIFEIRAVLNAGPGEHIFQIAFVYENTTTARLEERSTWWRLTGMKVREG